jgi:hypothetical protein
MMRYLLTGALIDWLWALVGLLFVLWFLWAVLS